MFPFLAPCFHFSNEPSARSMPIGRMPRWMTAATTGGKAKREDFVAAHRKEKGVALREA
jgi:hypothetical protein